jgi:hypothetical protein
LQCFHNLWTREDWPAEPAAKTSASSEVRDYPNPRGLSKADTKKIKRNRTACH